MRAYDMTHLIYSRTLMPDDVIASALEGELAALDRASALQFEFVESDASIGGYITNGSPQQVLEDSANVFSPSRRSNLHMTFKVSGRVPTEFILREIRVRCQRQTGGCTGMVFVSPTKPDLDSFERWFAIVLRFVFFVHCLLCVVVCVSLSVPVCN